MTGIASSTGLLQTAACAATGLAFGFAYFVALRRTVALFGMEFSRIAAVALTIGRFTAALVVFGFAARTGALPLLSVFAGFLVARTVALRSVRRAA